MKYSVIFVTMLCMTAVAHAKKDRRLLKEKMQHAKQHAKHNLGAPKLRAGEVAWATPAVCTSTNNGDVDNWGDGCLDGEGTTEYDVTPSFCGGLGLDSYTHCCGCGGGTCQAGHTRAMYMESDLGGFTRVYDKMLCCPDANIDPCGICNGDGSTCADACGVPNGGATDDSSCPRIHLNSNADCNVAKTYYNDQCSC